VKAEYHATRTTALVLESEDWWLVLAMLYQTLRIAPQCYSDGTYAKVFVACGSRYFPSFVVITQQGVAWRGEAPALNSFFRSVWAAKPPKRSEKGDSAGACGPHTPYQAYTPLNNDLQRIQGS